MKWPPVLPLVISSFLGGISVLGNVIQQPLDLELIDFTIDHKINPSSASLTQC